MRSGIRSIRVDEDAMARFMEKHYPVLENAGKKDEESYIPEKVVETKKSVGDWWLTKFAEAVEPWF
jgi:hypothetical protein